MKLDETQASRTKFHFLFTAEKKKFNKSSRLVDPELVGNWSVDSGTKVRIGSDDWYYLTSDRYPYSVAQDGSTLTFTGPNPVTVYQRLYGAGTTLLGVWTLTIQDGSDVYIEEVTYRIDGTYTSHWTLNSVFESEWLGNFDDQGTHIKSEERRALVSTSPPDGIGFDLPYDADFSGTYLKASADDWTLTIGPNSYNFVRLL